MFDSTVLKHDFFKIKLDIENEEGQAEEKVLKVKEPSVKVVSHLKEFKNDKSVEKLCEVIAYILSRNKENYKITAENLEEFTVSDLNAIFKAYNDWYMDQIKSKN